MAGGKETPRQKMIGMMYLVLTALLALNVSSAVLEKFAIMNVTLLELIEENKDTNATKLSGIMAATSDKPIVIDAKARAQKVRSLTNNTLRLLDSIKVVLSSGNKAFKCSPIAITH